MRGNLHEKKKLAKKNYHDKKKKKIGPFQFLMTCFLDHCEEKMVCEILTLIWLCGRRWAYLLCGVVALLIRNIIKIQDKHHHHTLLVFHRDYVSATLKIRPCKRDKMSMTKRKNKVEESDIILILSLLTVIKSRNGFTQMLGNLTRSWSDLKVNACMSEQMK